ncbi:hypothetical protein [Nostoc sp.]|uniref:hypothetical protein n=1 Tax=Nostoc sp. TaxID=1180 RepID=UPI002FFA40D1
MESLQLALASKGVRSAEFLILGNAANQIITSVLGVAREKLENRWHEIPTERCRERGGLQGYIMSNKLQKSSIASWVTGDLKLLIPTRGLFKYALSSTLSGKNPGFLANTFSTPQIIGEAEKAKLLSYKGFSVSVSVAKKWIKSS